MTENSNQDKTVSQQKAANTSSTEELNLLLETMDYQASTKDLSIRAPVKSDSDIGKIAQHYNVLIAELESLTNELGKRVNRRMDQISRVNNALANEVMDRKIAEHALADALHQAEAANKAKSTFLANMSHELRTPLNSIIGFSEMINQEIFGKINIERYEEYISAIHDSGNHLLTLINDILDLSKIDADSMILDEDVLSLQELIDGSVLLVKSMIECNNLKLSIEIPDDCPSLKCDILRFRQIIVNLLSNSIKFSSENGEILVRVSIETSGAITLLIKDNGIGIPKVSLESIFEPFIQIKDPSTRNIQGTGLGLSLVRSLIDLHGGRIGIESDKDQGTEIYLYFPAERSVTA